ncbi:hypothetical protein EDB89DRAFT_590977 [Lactarius sanguifluus]|nr:hypothetical protein EDB89DRAFT_590977 [Lactarius sanguifluus]
MVPSPLSASRSSHSRKNLSSRNAQVAAKRIVRHSSKARGGRIKRGNADGLVGGAPHGARSRVKRAVGAEGMLTLGSRMLSFGVKLCHHDGFDISPSTVDILDCVPSIDLQQMTISLLCILSYGRILNRRRYIFYHIHLKSLDSVQTLGDHPERTPGDADFIKKSSLATWTADADAAINVVLMIPELEWLSLCIDMNIIPDRSRRLSHKPMPDLRYLSLRCREFDNSTLRVSLVFELIEIKGDL